MRDRAIASVRRAVVKGILLKLDGSVKCVDCGEPAKHYDHRDYTKQLDVEPVCIACNYGRGKEGSVENIKKSARGGKWECLRCGYEWGSKAYKPKQCVYCKSYKWQVPRAKVDKVGN